MTSTIHLIIKIIFASDHLKHKSNYMYAHQWCSYLEFELFLNPGCVFRTGIGGFLQQPQWKYQRHETGSPKQ